MSRASLLNSYEAAFAFEHMMAHRNAIGVMSPLPRFSVLPYWLDPLSGTNQPASPWHLNHQQAHNDAANQLPTEFGSAKRGIGIWAPLLDYDFDDPDSREWWTFVNHLEHFVGGNTILPQSAPQPPPPAPQWTYPFW